MKKRVISVLLILILAMTAVFAADDWWVGKQISAFSLEGLSTVNPSDINNILYEYRGKPASTSMVSEMSYKLTKVNGIATVDTGAKTSAETGDLVLVFKFTELPTIGSISFEGNEKIKNNTLKEVASDIAVGSYINPENKAVFQDICDAIVETYATKGFTSLPVSYSVTENEEGKIDVLFTIQEGIQTRIANISFNGNVNLNTSSLKKLISSHKKSLFASGFLSEATVIADATAICEHYQSLGYLDAVVSYSTEDVPTKKSDEYQDVNLIFTIDEGRVWYFGGMDVTGNTVFSTEEITEKFSSEIGDIANYRKLEADYVSIQDLYYDNGYITTPISIDEERDEESMRVQFHVKIQEGPQCVIERIEIEGLEKTKDYVMRRELSLKEGDVFSKSELVTSLQNLYNTGLLEDVNYDITYGTIENGIVLKFICKEGSHMNIQFGATFGGNVTGFPVSGFLQWSDTNLGGKAQQIDVSTTLSPDSQTASISFGESWFRNVRWANSFDISFNHTKYKDEPQKGIGTLNYDDVNYDTYAYPLGYSNLLQWAENNFNNSKNKSDLMDYDLFSLGIGYSTGYTWIFNKGRLTVSGGADVSINKSKYDKNNKEPFDRLVYLYGQKWCFSNKISAGVQWDGRDYIQNTTKGYVLGTSLTYAGGVFGGLSNYNRISASASGYLKLFEVHLTEDTKNVMFCATTNVSAMLPQFYKNNSSDKWGWFGAEKGASRYEMLYLDGMTIARGHDTVTNLKLVWDNMLEVSYPVAENILSLEAFGSATAAKTAQKDENNSLDWYFSLGAGIKLKVPGFPLGLYLVKNYSTIDGHFKVDGGPVFSSSNNGLKVVLAISTSLI